MNIWKFKVVIIKIMQVMIFKLMPFQNGNMVKTMWHLEYGSKRVKCLLNMNTVHIRSLCIYIFINYKIWWPPNVPTHYHNCDFTLGQHHAVSRLCEIQHVCDTFPLIKHTRTLAAQHRTLILDKWHMSRLSDILALWITIACFLHATLLLSSELYHS